MEDEQQWEDCSELYEESVQLQSELEDEIEYLSTVVATESLKDVNSSAIKSNLNF